MPGSGATGYFSASCACEHLAWLHHGGADYACHTGIFLEVPSMATVLILHPCPGKEEKKQKYQLWLEGYGFSIFWALPGERFHPDDFFALILPGGKDVDPRRYGEEIQPYTEVDFRDDWEFQLLQEFLMTKKPVLGICRGIQVLNVALGGNLFQDISRERRVSISHQDVENPKNDLYHPVRIPSEAGIFQKFGKMEEVNSNHHQGIKVLAPSVSAVVFAPDGLVEAVEDRTGSILGVQWHPERLPEGHPARLAPLHWLERWAK